MCEIAIFLYVLTLKTAISDGSIKDNENTMDQNEENDFADILEQSVVWMQAHRPHPDSTFSWKSCL